MRRAALALVLAVLVLLPLTVTGPAAGAPRKDAVFAVQDTDITESSGLIDQGDTVVTINDSLHGPTLYVLDSRTGATVGRTTYSSDPAIDTEALARGRDGAVWVGDIGDNDAARDLVSVYRVGRVGPGDRTVDAQRYDLRYPGGPRDAETLLVDPDDGRLYVVSKGLFGGQLFEAPRVLRPDAVNLLRPVGRVGGLVTDGDFLPDGKHVVVRDYGDAFVYSLRPWEQVGDWALPAQPQGEGLSVRPSGTDVIVSSEGTGMAVLTDAIPPRLLRATSPQPTPTPSASPEDRGTAAPAQPSGASEDRSSGSPDVVAVAGIAAVGLAALVAVGALVRRVRQRRSTT